MHIINAEAQQKKLNRLSKQLTLSEHLLMNHPLTSGKFNILQTTLNYLNLQIKWSSAGSLARLLITLETALRGYRITESATGFVGPNFDKWLKVTAKLMKTVLSPQEMGKADLLIALNQIATFAFIYLTTQILGNWKQIFPQHDPVAAKKGGELYQELSLLFLFGSQIIAGTFHTIAKGLNLDKKHEKIVCDIGLFQLIITLLIVTEEENKKNEEVLDSLHRFMIPTLDSIEYAIERSYNQKEIEEDLFVKANTRLQLIRLALDKKEIEPLQQTIEETFEAFELPYKEVKNDLKLMKAFCKQLNLSFKNIFNQTETAMTSMTQAA